MRRDYHPVQPVNLPPDRPVGLAVVRVVEGELVAFRVEQPPARRAWTRPALPRPGLRRPQISWGPVSLRAAAVLVVVAVVAGLVWLTVQALLSLVTGLLVLVALVVGWVHANWLWLLLAAGLALFLLARFGSRSSCAGLHCRGCRR